MNTVRKGQKWKGINELCFNYGEVLTIVSVAKPYSVNAFVYYRDNKLKKTERSYCTRVWWIKKYCKELKESERRCGGVE